MQQELYSISDAIQIPLVWGQDGKIYGEAEAVFSLLKDVNVPMNIKALKVFKGEQVGVLFHVLGDLHLLVSNYKKTGSVSIYLLDASKVAVPLETLIQAKDNLRDVMKKVRETVVKVFHFKNKEWLPLTLPSV